MIIPRKNSLCAVVTPTQKLSFSPIENFCLSESRKILAKWDHYFLIPDNLDLNSKNNKLCDDFVRYSANHFVSNDSYNRWFLGKELFEKFLNYDRILVLQPDAILIKDDLEAWSREPYDLIGAPWFGRLRFTPSFKSYPALNGQTLKFEAGNGGLCLFNPRAIIDVQRRYPELIAEFARNSGGQVHQEGIYCFISKFDPLLKIATSEISAKFSLELGAREYFESGGGLPMGFHAMYKYDPELWMKIFPSSPHPSM